MARRPVASFQFLGFCALAALLSGELAQAQAPFAPPMPPPRPPLRYLPSAAEGNVVCADCSGDQAPMLVLNKDDVTIRVSARPTAVSSGTGASGKANITVNIKTKRPSRIGAAEDYITLRNKADNREYLLSPSDYKVGIFNLEEIPEGPASQTTWVDVGHDAAPPDEWPTTSDVTENSLDFVVSADLLSGSFSVQLPEILVNGTGYKLPPIQFEPQQQ